MAKGKSKAARARDADRARFVFDLVEAIGEAFTTKFGKDEVWFVLAVGRRSDLPGGAVVGMNIPPEEVLPAMMDAVMTMGGEFNWTDVQ